VFIAIELRQAKADAQRRSLRIPDDVSGSDSFLAATTEAIGGPREQMLQLAVLRRPSFGVIDAQRGPALSGGGIRNDSFARGEHGNPARA
jgi:hypothetical protein